MIYIIAAVITLLEIAWRPALLIWDGSFFVIPAIVLIAAGAGETRQWLIWLIAFILTTFFVPTSFLQGLLPLVVLSAVQFWVFRIWIHPDTVALKTGITGLLLLLYIAIALLPASIKHPLSLVGSLLLTLPIVFLWYWQQGHTRRSL